MGRKRKDQRYKVDSDTEKQVFSLIKGDDLNELVSLRDALSEQIQRIAADLANAPTEALAQTLALKSRRRGDARFEIDPDGQMVLVVSYGGEEQSPLSRNDLTPAWNKRPEESPKLKPKAKPEPKAKPKKKGFVKTSVAVSAPKVIPTTEGDDIDAILDAFNEDATPSTPPAGVPPEPTAEVQDGYVPKSRSRLRRIPGQPVTRGRGNEKSLAAIMSMGETKNGDDPT
ncbi:MAG: hypothetical protein VXX11_03165 [Planctomycetota bacterium]|nr:hypothetical protein [Planctomycetota bacterium]